MATNTTNKASTPKTISKPVTKPITPKETVIKETAINTVETDKLKEENELLKTQMKQLMDMMAELKESNKVEASTATIENNVQEFDDEEEYGYVEIPSNKPIQVVSLSDGGVSLKTSNGSEANVFRFDNFGTKLTIINSDLEKVLSMNRSFIEDGTVYICNKQFIKNHYLEEKYRNFITIDKINNILDFSAEEISAMVGNTTDTIQESIISLLVNKINKNEYVDFNKIEAVGKACRKPCNIRDLAYNISNQETKTE